MECSGKVTDALYYSWSIYGSGHVTVMLQSNIFKLQTMSSPALSQRYGDVAK